MKQIIVPDTDLSVSRLSFGTASLHHLATSSRRQSLLAAAFEHGFRHLDTAPFYGFGLAEGEVGRFLRSHTNHVTVATKVGLYPPRGPAPTTALVWGRKALGKVLPSLSRAVVDWSISTASQSLERSLRRLRRDVVDILFLHEPAPGLLDEERFLHWLVRQREAGNLRYWGLAGPAEKFGTWVERGHPLAQVLQVRDRVEADYANPLFAWGRTFQITYGYLAAARNQEAYGSAADVLRLALRRNIAGSVLVSTRRIARIPELAAAAEKN